MAHAAEVGLCYGVAGEAVASLAVGHGAIVQQYDQVVELVD